MRYTLFSKLLSTAALAGAVTLSAAPQADNLYNDPEETYMEQQTAVVQTTTVPSMSDHKVRHEIRKMIFHDVTMSNRARDVRVYCDEGKVTLKGSVPTNMEKQKIADKAAELVGSSNVIDKIQVKHHNFIG